MAKTLFDTKIDIVDLEFPNKGVGYFGEENKKVTVKNTPLSGYNIYLRFYIL